MGHGSWVTRVTGQLTHGSRGSWVIKCDPLSALIAMALRVCLRTNWHYDGIICVVINASLCPIQIKLTSNFVTGQYCVISDETYDVVSIL